MIIVIFIIFLNIVFFFVFGGFCWCNGKCEIYSVIGKFFYKGKGKMVVVIVEFWIIWIVVIKFIDFSDGKGFLGC